MIQASRARPHREAALEAVAGARCTRCHRLIRDTASGEYVFFRHGWRICMDCWEEG